LIIVSNRQDANALYEAPVNTWNGRSLIRVSIQGYNTRADVETLVTAVVRMIAEER
jgi:selenocysteine lyase/cysteine desulfurase